MCFFGHLYVFFVEMSIQVFGLFFDWVVYFLDIELYELFAYFENLAHVDCIIREDFVLFRKPMDFRFLYGFLCCVKAYNFTFYSFLICVNSLFFFAQTSSFNISCKACVVVLNTQLLLVSKSLYPFFNSE